MFDARNSGRGWNLSGLLEYKQRPPGNSGIEIPLDSAEVSLKLLILL